MWWADFQARVHWEDDVWAKSLGEPAGSSIGFCAEDATQGPQVGGQLNSGMFMEPKGGCCAHGEVEFEQQVVNSWDEVKESELACGRPCYSTKWLYLLFWTVWAPAEGWLLSLHSTYRWRSLTAAAIALWEVCVATTPELPHDLTPEPRVLTWVCLKEPAGD